MGYHADVVELVDTLDSGSSAREGMEVQVLSSALRDPLIRQRVFLFLRLPCVATLCNVVIDRVRCACRCSCPCECFYFLCMTQLDFEEQFSSAFCADPLTDGVVILAGIRESEPDFAEKLYEQLSQSMEFLVKHLPWVRETSVADIKHRIRGWVLAESLDQGCCWNILAGEGSRELAGFITMEVNLKNRSGVLSYWLLERYAGQGIMTRAVSLVSDFCFQKLGLNRLEISVSVNNPKSAAVARRSGFMEEGVSRDFELVNGVFEDHLRFSRLARDL